MSDKARDIPALPSNIDPDLKRVLDQWREAIQKVIGTRGGNPAVRAADMQAWGYVDQQGNSTGGTGGAEDPDLTPPPASATLTVTPAIASLLIEWEAPIYAAGHGHGQTNIYGAQWADGATEPVFEDASLIGSAGGALTIYAHPTNPNTRWCIWIRWQSRDGVEGAAVGGLHGVQATTGQDVSSLLDVLSGQITADELDESLSTPISQISTIQEFSLRGVNLADVEAWVVGSVAPAGWTMVGTAGTQWYFAEDVTHTGNGDLTLTVSNSTAGAKGWSSGGLTAAIDKSKTYRYVVPVKVVVAGAQVYWGPVGGTVCDVNTTAANANPYFCGTPTTAEWPVGEWCFLVGYVYPANSTGKTLSSAGVFRASTGERIANAGASYNFCWHPTNAAGPMRAFQIDPGTPSDKKVRFGKPLVHIVDGSEPPLESLWYSARTVQAAITTETSIRQTQTGQLFAKAGVRLDVNGYVTGWSLNNDGSSGNFIIRADTFAIGSPGQLNVYPVVVRTSTTTENGVTIPAGAYFDAAYIVNVSAMWGRFGTLIADSVQATAISAAQLTLGDGTVGGNLKSTNYVANVSGWLAMPSGYLEANDVVVRGTVFATAGEFSAVVRMGAASSYGTGVGLWQGYDGVNYVWRVGDPTGNRAQWDGAQLAVYIAGQAQPILAAGGISGGAGTIQINTPQFQLDGVGNVVMGGMLAAATGTFAGTLSAGTVTPTAFEAIVYEYVTAGSFSLTAPAKREGWAALAVRVTLQGGGGGGGGAYGTGAPNSNPIASGAGGGAGQRTVLTFEGVNEGDVLSLVVGAAGPGGAPSQDNSGGASAGNGTAGGVSSVTRAGVTYTANGGGGGKGGWRNSDTAHNNGFAVVPAGSLGGQQGYGRNAYTGMYSDGESTYYTTNGANGGYGGSSQYGAGGAAGGFAYRWAGNGGAGGRGAGGGGGGVDCQHPDVAYTGWGGPGGNGYILVEFYDPYSVVTNKRYSKLIEWLDTRGLGTVPTNAR